MRAAATRFVAARSRRPVGLPVALGIGVLLAFGVNDASAAALGSLVTSVGLFAALAALFVIKAWPAQLAASALSTAGGAIVIAGGAAWLWRAGIHVRGAGFVRNTRGRAPAPQPAVAPPCGVDAVQLPAGTDRDALLVELRQHFMRLQQAWDTGAMPALEALTTPEMLEELRLGLPASTCDAPKGGSTDVVTLRADLFGYDELPSAFLVSVEFSGLMRESAGQCAVPFRELWMLTRSKDGASGWKLARHQALL